MQSGDRVTVVGPAGSAQFGKTGTVVEVGEYVVVKLDGEDRSRNFRPENLKGA